MTADEVLIVLNGLESVDLGGLEFGVITETYRENGSWWPFERGEVLVLDRETGREPFGEGRKPAKWDVTCETAATFAEAMRIRNAIPVVDEWSSS